MWEEDRQKEAYHYQNYFPSFQGARIREVHESHTNDYSLQKITPYRMAEAMASLFLESTRNSQSGADLEDLFQQKVESEGDRINLILNQMHARDRLKYENLKSLYDDLLRIDNWRIQIPYPQSYEKGRTWTDLNKMELQIRDQIRRETKDFAKDTAFPNKDLRESLLEFKVQKNKSDIMGGFDEIEPEGSYEPMRGDMYYIPKP